MFDKAKIDDRMRRAQHVREIEFCIPQKCIGGLPEKLQLCEFSDSTERVFDELQVAALINQPNAAIAPVKHAWIKGLIDDIRDDMMRVEAESCAAEETPAA